jgi:glycine C-acetyltransferase
MNRILRTVLGSEVASLKQKGLFRHQRVLQSEQAAQVLLDGQRVVMLGSNNYLGLASHPKVKEAVKSAVEKYGSGTASVSEVCGLTDLHHELARRIADFTGSEAALLYSSCSTANLGVIDCLMRQGDVILSDQFNHASIADGCRISSAHTKVYPHKDMGILEGYLQESHDARLKMIVTVGVFSMIGDTSPLGEIVALADKYSAITVVDESHALGVLGKRGKGTIEYHGVEGRVDIQTGTFGKALAAAGGYVCGGRELIDYLYNMSGAFIHTNALPPAVVAAAIAGLTLLEEDPGLLQRLWDNTKYFRKGIEGLGLQLLGGESPIIPIVIGDAEKAFAMRNALLEEGVFITAVGYPVVPAGAARLRAQVSAAHAKADLDYCLEAIERASARAISP